MESFNFEQYKVARCYVAISDEYSDLLKAEIKKTNGKACENGALAIIIITVLLISFLLVQSLFQKHSLILMKMLEKKLFGSG